MNKKTHFIIYINRTIHVIKYLHAENGNQTEQSETCGHNVQNRLCPVIKGRCHHGVILLLVGGINGLIMRVVELKEGQLEGISEMVPWPHLLVICVCVCLYDRYRE